MIDTVQAIIGGVVDRIKGDFHLVDTAVVFKEFMIPFIELAYMFSLYYQETKVTYFFFYWK
jgi:hypothetical protein